MSDERVSECKSCGAEVKWMKTLNGKNIPVDLPAIEDPRRDDILEATLFDRKNMTTHFETCPNAAAHRLSRASAKPVIEGSPEKMARALSTALSVLEDISKSAPDGYRSQELAKTTVSQIRSMR